MNAPSSPVPFPGGPAGRDPALTAAAFTLGRRAPAHLWASRCLAVRFPYLGCARCATACPVGCLTVTAGEVGLAEGCLGCGRCASACPTAAFAVAGFGCAPPVGSGPLPVDCWRVPAEHSPAGAYRVPCLGGLAVSRLLTLAAAGRAVLLLDRGWCARCSAGQGSAQAGQAAAEEASALLAAAGAESRVLPRVESRPLPERLSHPRIPAPAAAQPLTRRVFFGRLAAEVTARAREPAGPNAPADAGPPRPVEPEEWTRRSETLRGVAAARGRTLPAECFAAVVVGESCCNHRVCAAVCPTGALRGYQADGASGLRFDPAACIACEACQRTCPERAIQVRARGARDQDLQEGLLTRFVDRTCTQCEAVFSDLEGGELLCPHCRRRQGLARAGFFLSMAARRAEQTRPRP